MPLWSRKKEKDPVCGMEVDTKKATATREYQGKTYSFCAPSCQASFTEDPMKYVKGPQESMGDMNMEHH